MSKSDSIQATVQQLKEIITRVGGVDHESVHLVSQIELLLNNIEKKAQLAESTVTANAQTSATAQIPV